MRFVIVALVMLMCGIASAEGLFDITRPSAFAWVQDDEIKVSEGLALELIRTENKVWVGDVVLSQLQGSPIGGLGVSLNIQAWCASKNFVYQPGSPVYVGGTIGLKEDALDLDEAVYGFYVSMLFG